ncbi:ABC transporter permease [Mycoplasmatota bacterium]|nr:ABC transporter permease [Mycoplasmatota bacterium]
MKKFRFLIKYGLGKRLKRKAFIISNIIVLLLTIVIVNIPQIIDLFSSDEVIENIYIEVQNDTDEPLLVDELDDWLNQGLVEDLYIISEINAFNEDDFWLDDSVDMIFVFSGDINHPQVDMYSKYPDSNANYQSSISLFLIDYQVAGYQSPLYVENFAPDYEDPDQTAFVNSISSLLVLPIFLLIIMATQFVGVDIIEEKSSKAIETIIASVPAKIHFLSKVTSAILFVIIQSSLVLVYGTIAALISRLFVSSSGADTDSLLQVLGQLLPNWPLILLFTILFTFIGAIFYLVIAAMFASMAVTQEDYQQFQTPLMMTLLVAYYIAIFGSVTGGTGFLAVMSFIPIFTPIVAPIAYAIGAISLVGTIIAVFVSIAIMVLSLYLVAPIYKIAILSYEQTKFGKRIKGYFKKAFKK